MGTWGEGIYDNDSALDALSNLLAVGDDEKDVGALTAHLGLRAWLNPVLVTLDRDDLERRVREQPADLERLPAGTRAALEALLADPEAATGAGSRSPAAKAVIGGYCDGPRLDPLLRFAEAGAVIDRVAEGAARRLDQTLAAKVDLYEVTGAMASLGVLVELALAGLWQPAPERVASWRVGFTVIDKATREERGFWWKYVSRVRDGFNLLAPDTTPPAPPRAPRAAHTPAAPVERFHHPKLGTGSLVSRSVVDGEERLELRFEDGQTRKFPVRLVTPLQGD